MSFTPPLESSTAGATVLKTVPACPESGGVLGPFTNRNEAPAAEQAWLKTHWLVNANSTPGGTAVRH